MCYCFVILMVGTLSPQQSLARWDLEPVEEVCVVAGYGPEGGGCNCVKRTFANNGVIIATWWEGCVFNEEAPLPCMTTCDCSDRFGGVVGDTQPEEFPESNLGAEPTTDAW